MKARKLLCIYLSLIGVAAVPVPAAHALLVKVQINFGSVITGPDNGTLVVEANPGDLLDITWALGTDSSMGLYRGIVSALDNTEITRFGGSALELTGQGFDPAGNPNAQFPDEGFYNA